MATWEIDRFAAIGRETGAQLEYGRILVDDDGNLQYVNVPGEKILDGVCLVNYKRSYRSFSPDQLITEFCNLDTFTNFRIYAQDCRPFAYVQTDINATKCGFATPLPQPFIPQTPWGSPSYGLYAYINICDDKGKAINIRIYKRSYLGDPIQIKNSGDTPVIISYKNTDDNKFNTIRSCELLLTLVSDANFNIEQLYTQDEREFKVEIIKDSIVKFLGFGTPAEASEEFTATPYDLVWRATDGLDALQKIDYPIPIGSSTDIRQSFIEILCYCLAMTNLNLELATICNVYETKMLNSIDNDPLAQATINPLRFIDNGVVFNCYKVLQSICTIFGAFIVQNDGVWYFVRQSELTNTVLRKRMYKYTGLYLRSEQFYNKRTATCKGDDIIILDNSPTLIIGNAYKRAEAVLDLGESQLLIYNGNFEIYNGSNFAGWTKYGGIKVSQIEKQIQTTTGTVPSGNFALQFDEIANSGKYLETSKVQITLADKITLSFFVGNTGPNSSPSANINNITFRVRIKLGEYYLATSITPGGNYFWIKQLTTFSISLNNSSLVIDAYQVKLNMPDAPVDGDMTIQLFGFDRSSVYMPLTNIYYPIYIDGVSLEKSTDNIPTGQVMYITQQDGFYTNKPDLIKLLFGDISIVNPKQVYTDGSVSIISNIGSTQIKNEQYAIYTVDGSFSSGWYEYGSSAAPVPLGLLLTRSIMKAYKAPFRFLQSSFLGNNISYLDIFNVYLPDNTDFNNRIFALLSGDFNLGTGELTNANYAEIFIKPGKTTDIIIPGNSGDPAPPIPQNPNPTAVITDRIFTNEFTNPFK